MTLPEVQFVQLFTTVEAGTSLLEQALDAMEVSSLPRSIPGLKMLDWSKSCLNSVLWLKAMVLVLEISSNLLEVCLWSL
jgi:hypothetical protein